MRRFKYLWVIPIIILIISPAFWAGTANGAYDLQPGSGIDIKAQIGFDKLYKLGYSAPVYFEIDNKIKDISGELQVELPTEFDSATVYAINVNLPKNSVKRFTMNIPMQSFATKLKVKLVEGKNTVAAKDIRIEPGVSMDTMAIGILSDDFESVKYINKMTLGINQSYATKTVRLDEKSFPVQADVVNMFNVIVINNYDTSKLSMEQYSALKKWVSGGGLLLLGTGPSYSKTLNIFQDDFINGQTGNQSVITTTAISDITAGKAEGTAGTPMNLSIVNVDIKDSMPILKEGTTILVSKLSKGKGVIGTAAFDFGLEPLTGWVGGSEFADRLISRLLPPLYASVDFQKGMAVQNNEYAMDNSLRNIPELPMPKISYIFIIFGVYILAAAPISYMVLKKLDRRELMWITVPILSIVFSIAVYIAGFGTRLSEPVVNIISLVDIDDKGFETVKSYAGIFTPTKNNIRVEASGSTRFKPVMANNGYRSSSNSADSNAKQIEAKLILEPKTVAEFYKTGVWSMKTIAMEAIYGKTGGLTSSISFIDDKFVGTIKNDSGYDLYESYIIAANQYVATGAIKNGETKKIEVKASSYFGNKYDLMNAIYKDPYSGPNPPKKYDSQQLQKLRTDNQKRQIMDYYFMGMGMAESNVKLMGWSKSKKLEDILVNGKTTRRYEKQFITANVYLNFKNGGTAEYPFGYLKPTIINNLGAGSYDELGKMFYGRGTVEIDYPIDKDIAPQTIKIKYTVGSKNTKQFIWNVQQQVWEEGEYSNFTIDGDKVYKYLDGSNTLKIKLELADDNVQVPQISVKGSVK